MDGHTTVMFASSMLVMVLATLSVSYKTGFVAFSIFSATRKGQPKFEVDKSKIGKFVALTIGVFLLDILYGIVVLQDMNEIEGILIFALFNTVFIAYGLAFWVLLKEKKIS